MEDGAMEDTALKWRKASSSSNGGGNCVEVADHANCVLVRDTKKRTGPALRFSPAAWRRFADQVKRSLLARSPARIGAALASEGWLLRLRRAGWLHCFGLCWGRCGSGRSARPRGGGRREEVRGNRAVGGSGFSRCLQLPPAGGAARYGAAARAVFLGHLRGGVCRCLPCTGAGWRISRAKSGSRRKGCARRKAASPSSLFLGLLGRDRVCALYKSDLEMPSDYSGVLFIEADDRGAWKLELLRELQAAEIPIDWQRIR